MVPCQDQLKEDLRDKPQPRSAEGLEPLGVQPRNRVRVGPHRHGESKIRDRKMEGAGGNSDRGRRFKGFLDCENCRGRFHRRTERAISKLQCSMVYPHWLHAWNLCGLHTFCSKRRSSLKPPNQPLHAKAVCVTSARSRSSVRV